MVPAKLCAVQKKPNVPLSVNLRHFVWPAPTTMPGSVGVSVFGATSCVGVITNFDDTATAYEILARHGILPRLGAVVVSEAIGLRKPSPVLVRLALRELDVPAPDAVMIGDHAIEDVGAANAAGVDAIWIDKTGEGVTDGNPTPRWIVRSLLEVAPILG